MATDVSSSLKAAFDQYVGLIRQHPDVLHVVAVEEGPPELFTFIRRRDDALCRKLFRAEDEIIQRHPELAAEFHIRYLDGRKLEQFAELETGLVYSRSADAKF